MAKEKGYTRRVDVSSDSIASSPSALTPINSDLLFGKKNYLFIGIGVALIFIGMGLMSGGHMPSPDVWDESLIYSFRRITLAPIVILTGLAVNVYAIFIKK